MTRGAAELALGVGAFALLLWGLHRLGGFAHGVAQGVNPTSPDNYAYTGVNAVGAALTGDNSFSFGSWLYDATHASYDPNAPAPDPLGWGVTSGGW